MILVPMICAHEPQDCSLCACFVCSVSGGLQSSSLHPTALDKIKHLEAPRIDPQQEIAPTFGNPTFTQHLNNLAVAEKGTAVFQARLDPAKDPTMKIGKWSQISFKVILNHRVASERQTAAKWNKIPPFH